MTDKKPEELGENDLKDVKGGIGLLLPAVQKVREPSRKKPQPKPPTGSSKIVHSGGGSDI